MDQLDKEKEKEASKQRKKSRKAGRLSLDVQEPSDSSDTTYLPQASHVAKSSPRANHVRHSDTGVSDKYGLEESERKSLESGSHNTDEDEGWEVQSNRRRGSLSVSSPLRHTLKSKIKYAILYPGVNKYWSRHRKMSTSRETSKMSTSQALRTPPQLFTIQTAYLITALDRIHLILQIPPMRLPTLKVFLPMSMINNYHNTLLISRQTFTCLSHLSKAFCMWILQWWAATLISLIASHSNPLLRHSACREQGEMGPKCSRQIAEESLQTRTGVCCLIKVKAASHCHILVWRQRLLTWMPLGLDLHLLKGNLLDTFSRVFSYSPLPHHPSESRTLRLFFEQGFLKKSHKRLTCRWAKLKWCRSWPNTCYCIQGDLMYFELLITSISSKKVYVMKNSFYKMKLLDHLKS